MKCPRTLLFNLLKKKFSKALENGDCSLTHQGCETSLYAGKVCPDTMKRLESDEQTRQDVSRGIVQDVSILFADIRNFTARTAEMPPERIVQLLDLFIPEMLHIIKKNRGMADKLLGDGVMARFGHPYRTGQETLQALYAAIDMQQAAFAMGDVLRHMDYEPISIGVGINTGEALICTVGDESYREVTVIGAPVNIASKMEDEARADEIVLTEQAMEYVLADRPEMREFFAGKSDLKHGQTAYSFEWAEYLREGKAADRPLWSLKLDGEMLNEQQSAVMQDALAY